MKTLGKTLSRLAQWLLMAIGLVTVLYAAYKYFEELAEEFRLFYAEEDDYESDFPIPPPSFAHDHSADPSATASTTEE